MNVLFANIPFVTHDPNGQIYTGPSAGSRWPFTLPGAIDYAPFPFFMGYATSYLHHHGIDADFYDGVALRRWDYNLVRQDIASYRPDLLILETATPLANTILEFARWAKKELGSKIVLVGPHIAVYGDELLKDPAVDYVVVGEYEKPILDIIRNPDGKRKFVYEHIENINTINGNNWLPYRPMDYLYNYWDCSMPTPRAQLTVSTSRGCPFKCTYCQWPKVMNNGQYRAREPEMVLDEIKTVALQARQHVQKRELFMSLAQQINSMQERGEKVQIQALIRHANGLLSPKLRHLPAGDDRAGIQSIFFDDDTWNLGTGRVKKLCDGLKAIGLPWTMMGRIDTSSLPLYDQMVDSGCVGMRFGVESFNQKLLDNTKKHLDAEKSYSNIKYLVTRFENMEFHFTTMKNLPGETDADWQEDSRKLDELREIAKSKNNRVHWQNSDCIAFPGTELWEEMVALGRGEALLDFDMYNGQPEKTGKLAEAVGWLGEDYKAKWHKYSKMGKPELLPKDSDHPEARSGESATATKSLPESAPAVDLSEQIKSARKVPLPIVE